MKRTLLIFAVITSALLAVGDSPAPLDGTRVGEAMHAAAKSPDRPRVAFDLSHGQFQDVFVKPSYYDYVLPAYREICGELGAEYSEIKEEITP